MNPAGDFGIKPRVPRRHKILLRSGGGGGVASRGASVRRHGSEDPSRTLKYLDLVRL